MSHIKIVIKIIKACSFIDTDSAKWLNDAIENASSDELKYYTDHANKEVDNYMYIENIMYGYIAYVEPKPKKVEDFHKYTTIRIKGDRAEL